MAEVDKLFGKAEEAINKKNGKVNSTPRWVVSKDGRTLTIQWQGTNAQGQGTNIVEAYDPETDRWERRANH